MSNDTQSNPFPGLRPFEREQYKLFFGREGQSEEILSRLEDHRFLAVVGSSGSGKSSLIRAGLIPYLYGGFIPGATSHWRVALLRPEHDPIGNLVNSLNKPEVFGKKSDDPKERKRDAMMLEATLRRSGLGLIEAVKLARLPKDQQILVVVDQFEELFRFATAAGGTHHYEDAAAFVKLLLEASGQSDVPIYVVLTMRSDFIGDCAQFRDLAEQVTTGLYLIPRMSRDQRRRAIVEPVRVADGKIAPRLVTRLLNDVGETDDQLPILQHVLMRTWDHWQTAKPNRPMDLEDYEKVGEWAEALSLHADEAFAGLPDDRHRDVAKRVFQALTERGTDNRETRRPTRLENLANITGETGDAIKLVVEEFRKPRHSFLMPPTTAVLEPSTIIDISHESLIRRWRRLRDWVDEEAQSAKDYRHVAETAARRALRGDEKSGLWHDTELEDALKWRGKQRPTLEWAKRYDDSGDPRFETAMDFLERSRVASDERKAQLAADRARRERLKRRIFVGSIAASVVLCVLSAVSIWQWRAATKSEQAASKARIQAEASEKAAVSAKEEAVVARGRAEKSETAALETQSHFLADLANQSTRAGDAGTAAMLALEALPDANDPQNRVKSASPDAKKALSYALQRLQEGVILNGHADSVSSVMFNPVDSKILVTTGWDTTVLLWDLSGKKPTSRLLGKHDDPVRSVDFSPDGKSILTASHDKTARIWDAAGQKEIRRFVGHTDWVQSAVFSPGTGKYVLTGSRDRTARLWDAETEKLLGKIGHKEPVQYASFSPEGNIIVTAAGKDVFLWDVAKVLEAGAQDNGNSEAGAAPISLPRGHDSPVLMVLFSRDGKKIVTASFDKTAKVWDVSDRSKPVQIASFEGHDDLVLGATFSPDAKKVLTASIDETARLWDVTEQRVIGLFKGHDDGVWNAVFSPDGRTIATTSFDNTVRLWNVSSKSESGSLEGHKGDIWFAAFSPDEKRIATASFDKTVRLWDPATGREIWKSPEYGDWVRTVTFSPDSRTLVTTSDKEAILWDVEKQKRIGELKGHTSIVSNAVFRPTDGKIILTASYDKTARLWDAETLKEISKIEGHGDFLMSAAFSPDGKMVVTASRDKTAKLWDVSNPEKPIYIGALAGHEKWVMDASFTSDGKMIATASWDKTVRLWDVRTQKQLALLVGGAPARTVRFSADNHMIITTSDNTARLWDVSDLSAPSELQVLKGHKSIVRSATFSPNGHTIVTASSDTTARLWPVDPKSQEGQTQTLVDRAKQEVPRCLTVFQRKDAFLDLKPPAWCIDREKWPYDSKDWKQWLEYERAKQNPPLPGSVEWGPWLSARATGSTTATSNPK